jgi:hypothetical protein
MRDVLAGWAAAAVAILAIGIVTLWPGGILVHSPSGGCNPSGTANVTIEGTSYCVALAPNPPGTCPVQGVPPAVAWTRFWGYLFGLSYAYRSGCPSPTTAGNDTGPGPLIVGGVGEAVLNLWVISPSGYAGYTGTMVLGGLAHPVVWIAPDGESGVDWNVGDIVNPVVMVESGR